MNPSLHFSKQIPAWHRERATRLHRICSSIAARSARGEKRKKIIRRFVWTYKNRNYKCDARRPLNFSTGAISRAFYIWRRNGQVAAALLPQYKPRQPALTAPILIRLTNFCASQRFETMKAAWERFSARGGNRGFGRRARKRLKISYGQVRYYFPASNFYQLQGQLKAASTAQKNLGALRLQIIAQIRERLPDYAPRRRNRELDFQI